MKAFRFITQIILSIVFIFSGFVKAVDPLGSAYKFVDYFTAFGMEAFIPLALPLAFILSTAEFLIGVSLLLGVKPRLGIWGAFIFMLVFTPLTFYLAIKDPVQDCGCFGDAIILTNWQTFYKNVVIHALVIFIFIDRKDLTPRFCCKAEWGVLGGFVLLIMGFSVYCFMYLPIIDFRPYKIGAHIPEQMIIPEDAPTDEYDIVLLYKKDGITEEFTLEDMPDSTWTWVNTNNILTKKGYEPPIHDFSISTLDGMDITDIILEEENFTFLLVAYDLKKANTLKQKGINNLASYCNQNNINFICLTSSLIDEIADFEEEYNTEYSFYNTDEIPLKTMVRANPGLILLKKGTILGKWSFRDIPSVKKLEEKYLVK